MVWEVFIIYCVQKYDAESEECFSGSSEGQEV